MMTPRHTMRNAMLLILLFLLSWSCAKQGYPSGGPTDKTPPVVVAMTPPNETSHFQEKSFYLEFDEYVTVKDADNNILISPPMAKKPEYTPKGHGIVVKLKDTLQPNTTYLFQFKEAIADFNEGNLLNSLEYVFTTGDVIDSMSLSGRVVDALSGKPNEDPVSILLYRLEGLVDSLSRCPDSLVLSVNPVYITRCDKEGNFTFHYLQPGQYKLLALVDDDKDLRMGASERVAFVDTLLTAVYVPKPKAVDSTAADSLDPADSLLLDKTAASDKGVDSTAVQPAVSLFRLFAPRHEQQRVTSSEFKKRGRIMLTTQLPMQQPQVQSMGDSLIWRLNARRDTMTLWTRQEKCDSVRFILSDASGLRDTLKLRYQQPKKPVATTLPTPLVAAACGSSIPYFDTLRLHFNNPVQMVSVDSVVRVLSVTDSVRSLCGVVVDSTGLQARLTLVLQPGAKYQIMLPAKLFTDLYGNRSDSLAIATEVTTPDKYGTLKLALSASLPSDSQLLVQLLDEKDTVVRMLPVKALTGEKLQFEHLNPGKYRIRAILDRNANGRWDTGNYWLHQQPEQVYFLGKQLDIRANWEFEEEWKLTL